MSSLGIFVSDVALHNQAADLSAPGRVPTHRLRRWAQSALLFAATLSQPLQAATIESAANRVQAGETLELQAVDVAGEATWATTLGSVTASADGRSALFTAPFEEGEAVIALADDNDISVVTITVVETPAHPSLLTIPGGRVRLVAGDVHPLSLIARFSDGRSEDYTTRVEWVSENPQVATIESDGVVVAQAPGEGTIVATHGGLKARIKLVVEPRIGQLRVVPSPLLISESGHGRLTITQVTSRGEQRMVNVNQCLMSVEPATIARVESGRVIGQQQGQGDLQINCSEGVATVPLFVNPDGALAVTPERIVVSAGAETPLLMPSGGAPPYLAMSEEGEVKEAANGFTVVAPGAAGHYRVWVSDDLGERVEVQMEVVAALRVTPAIIDLQRGEERAIAAIGGQEPLNWTTLHGTITAQSDGGAIYRAPEVSGIDEITVFDSRGQRQRVLVNIESGLVTSPQVMVLEPSGAMPFHVVGGTPPYRIVASAGTYGYDGDRFNYRAPDVAGQYTITVEDTLGRQQTINVNVRRSLQITPHELFVAPEEEMAFEVTGGFGDRVYTAKSGEIVENEEDGSLRYRAPLQRGVDLVTVTDQEGSVKQMVVSVSSNGLFVSPARSYLLTGEEVRLRAMGGTPPYSWTVEGVGDLSASEGEQVLFTAGTTTGTPLVNVMDANGNQISAEIIVSNGQLKVTPELALINPGETIPLKALFGVPGFQWSVRRGSLSALEGAEVEYSPPDVPLGEDLVTVEDGTGLVATVRVVFVRDKNGDILAIYGDGSGRVRAQSMEQALGDFFSGAGWVSRGDLYRLLDHLGQ